MVIPLLISPLKVNLGDDILSVDSTIKANIMMIGDEGNDNLFLDGEDHWI